MQLHIDPLDVLTDLFTISIEILGRSPFSEGWDGGREHWVSGLKKKKKKIQQTPKEREHFMWPWSR